MVGQEIRQEPESSGKVTVKDNVGAAILGFYGAIKICLRDGYDPEKVFRLVQNFLQEQKQNEGELGSSVRDVSMDEAQGRSQRTTEPQRAARSVESETL